MIVKVPDDIKKYKQILGHTVEVYFHWHKM